MIRNLRKRHRTLLRFVSLISLVAIFIAISNRNATEYEGHGETASLFLETSFPSILANDYGALWPALPDIQVLLHRSLNEPFVHLLEITSPEDVNPDVLVYWHPRAIAPADQSLPDGLPPGSVFLGSWTQEAHSKIIVPKQLIGQSGALILYSLPNRQIVAKSDTVVLEEIQNTP